MENSYPKLAIAVATSAALSLAIAIDTRPVSAQTFSGNASGTFGTPNSGLQINPTFAGVGTNTFTWGEPITISAQSNQLIFEGIPFATDINTVVELGNLTYTNGITILGTEVDSVPLNVFLEFSTPTNFSTTFTFNFELVNTLNTDDPQESADFVFPPNTFPSQSFNVDGTDVTLEFVGFSQDDGVTLVDEFRVLEEATTTATLFGRITQAPPAVDVPEPASVLGLLALGALGATSTLTKKHSRF